MRRLSSMGLHRCLACVLIAFIAACKSPPPAPSHSPKAAPTPRPVLSFELETDEGVLRVLDDGSISHALFGEDEYGWLP